MTTTTISIRMDKNLKKEADSLFDEMGLTMSAAVNMFVRKAVRTQKIPFEVDVSRVPNEETAKAIAAGEEEMQTAKGYKNLGELFSALES